MKTDNDDITIELTTCLDNDLTDVISELLNELTENSTGITSEELLHIIDNKSSLLFVARQSNRIIGMATLCTYCSPSGRKAWIEDVVVNSKRRGEGIGSKLIDHIIDYARHNLTPCSIMLTSRPSRITANALYKSKGFTLRQTNVYKLELK